MKNDGNGSTAGNNPAGSVLLTAAYTIGRVGMDAPAPGGVAVKPYGGYVFVDAVDAVLRLEELGHGSEWCVYRLQPLPWGNATCPAPKPGWWHYLTEDAPLAGRLSPEELARDVTPEAVAARRAEYARLQETSPGPRRAASTPRKSKGKGRR